MKRNKMMRLASMLLVAVLVTTTTISGTYAKYVTTDGASDTARVAKFGVVVSAEGGLFDTTYKTGTNTPGGVGAVDTDGTVLSVESYNGTDKLVAPGTKNTDGITFSITGTPEVDVNISLAYRTLGGTYDNDVFLGKPADGKEYPDMTTGDVDGFTFAEDYYPVKYTLVHTPAGGGAATTGNLAAIKTKLNTVFATTFVDANTPLESTFGTFKLTWEWEFEPGADEAARKAVNQKDTMLGDLMANPTIVGDAVTAATAAGVANVVAPTNYNLYTGIGFDITVTQVD